MPGAPRASEQRVMRVAQMLLTDGYFSSEVDAVLAAVRLLAVADEPADSGRTGTTDTQRRRRFGHGDR